MTLPHDNPRPNRPPVDTSTLISKSSSNYAAQIEQLFAQPTASVALAPIRSEFSGRTLLVTGAAGSIGSEICKQLLTVNPKHVACLDHNKPALSDLRLGLAPCNPSALRSFYVADILDAPRIQEILLTLRPEIVFHVAAEKHVVLMESSVKTAVNTNVFGTQTVLQAATAAGVEKFILISSDKAVYPASVVGVTKRIGELMLAARPTSGISCISARFGNVFGSSGSVIPIWAEQLRNGEPLTVTHLDAQRFFFSPSDAASRLLQATTIGQHADIFVFDMYQPIRIIDLAHAFLRHHAALSPSQADRKIQFIGLREGEKLTEELFHDDEPILPTVFANIKRTSAFGRNQPWQVLSQQLTALSSSLAADTDLQVRTQLKTIVPHYCLPLLTSAPILSAGPR
jgi:FlaA1/EpsC-like NDP-sugar epimerase